MIVPFTNASVVGSPYKVLIDYPVDATKVFATGPGLDAKNCRANVPLSFYVDASRSGYAPLNVDVKTEKSDSRALAQSFWSVSEQFLP